MEPWHCPSAANRTAPNAQRAACQKFIESSTDFFQMIFNSGTNVDSFIIEGKNLALRLLDSPYLMIWLLSLADTSYFFLPRCTSPILFTSLSVFSAYTGTGLRRRSSIKVKIWERSKMDQTTRTHALLSAVHGGFSRLWGVWLDFRFRYCGHPAYRHLDAMQ